MRACELFLSDGSKATASGTSGAAAVQRYADAHRLIEVVAWQEASADADVDPPEPEAEL